MRTVVVACFIVFCAIRGFGQIKVSGQITGDGVPVPNANVILYSKGSNPDLITYSSSDKNGHFELEFANNADSLLLEINCMGFEKLQIKISGNAGQLINARLKVATIPLQEVNIQEDRPITQKNDTLNYKVLEFSDKSDRVILDIIKKLPGITVTKTGQIMYQDKAINKFYIDGKDLLGDRYNIATNNLPSKDVDQVQVLENHQPIKMLRGIDETDRAAINIKLVDSVKTKLLGGGNAGAGFSPFLRNNSLTTLKFNKDLQFITSVKNNNIGINLGDELTEQNVPLNFYESGAIKKDMLFLVKASPPPLDEDRYWFNNNTLGDGNFLLGLSKNITIKSNIAYVNDILNDRASSLTSIYLPADTVIIPEDYNGHRVYNKLLGDIVLEANTDKSYLNNTLRVERTWNSSKDIISSTGISQNLKDPFINVLNNFSGIIAIGGTIVNLGSFTSYSNLPQELNVSPGQFQALLNNNNNYDETIQKVVSKTFYTNNYVSAIQKLGQFSVGNKLGMLLSNQTLNNNLDILSQGIISHTNNDFNNYIQRGKVKLYDDLDVTYHVNRLSFGLLVKSSGNSLNNVAQSGKMSMRRFVVNPGLNIKYNFSQSLEGVLNASENTNLSYNSNQTFILQNYRSLENSSIPLMETIDRSLSYRMHYKDVVRALFSNFDINYIRSSSNILLNHNYNGINSTTTAIERDNPSKTLNLSGNISKFYRALKTTVDLSIGYNISKYLLLQQDILSHFESDVITFKTKIYTNPNKILAFEYDFEVINNRSFNLVEAQQTAFSPVTSITQNLVTKLFMPKDILVKINFENYINSGNGNTSVNYFSDVIFQKTITNKNLDLSVALSNVFDVKSYTNYSYSSNYFVTSNYNLRPRMVMINCSFQF